MTPGTCDELLARASWHRSLENSMNFHQCILSVHVAFGAIALVSYWIAALARKGSPLHKLAGKTYLLVMLVVLAGALPLSLRILLKRDLVFGGFLLYLLLITATVMWQGWFASRNKRNFAAYAGPAIRRLAWANVLGGVAIAALGLFAAQPVLIGFSLVGLLNGRSMLRLLRSGPAHPRWWLQEHLGAMLGCGVATHIAFLQIGLPILLPQFSASGSLHLVAWLGPLAVAALARWWLGRKYLPQRNAAGAAQVA